MWASASDLARFSIKVMRIYGGQSDPVLSPEMAMQMLTPQIASRGLGPSVFDVGDDLSLCRLASTDSCLTVGPLRP